MKADIVVGLQYGDEGKGKVAHHLAGVGDYTHVIRFNGGCNAGHTIIHEGEKVVTHHIPCGVFFGIKSIIGPGCVIDPRKFRDEAKMLMERGIDVASLLRVDKRVHLITPSHKTDDNEHEDGAAPIGSTRTGNGPAYRDKHARNGARVDNAVSHVRDMWDSGWHVDGASVFLPNIECDIYDELYKGSEEPRILFEGAQGFGIDIDWGDYPFVTSSHCLAGAATLTGVPPKRIDRVYGVAKIYETYVGAKSFQPDGVEYDVMQRLGQEFGATTGRKRQCNWLDLDTLIRSINVNGVTDLIINKCDVMADVIDTLGYASVYAGENRQQFKTLDEMTSFISESVRNACPYVENVILSSSPAHV